MMTTMTAIATAAEAIRSKSEEWAGSSTFSTDAICLAIVPAPAAWPTSKLGHVGVRCSVQAL